MQRESLTSLAYGIAVATAVVLGAFIALSMMARQEFENARDEFINLTGAVRAKEVALDDIRSSLGYLGFAGNLEKIISGGEGAPLAPAREDLDHIRDAMSAFGAEQLSSEERADLDRLHQSVGELQSQYERVRSNLGSGFGLIGVMGDVQETEAEIINILGDLTLLQRANHARIRVQLTEAIEATRQFIAIGALFVPFIMALAIGVVWFSYRLLSAITERDQAQSELRAVNEDLERIVDERTRDLAETNIALAEREKQLKDMSDALPIQMSYIDADGIYRSINKAYSKFFDLPPDKIVGRGIKDLLPSENHSRLDPLLERVLNGEAVSDDLKITGIHAEPVHFRIEFVPDKAADGTVLGFYAALQDISRQKATETALIRATEEAVQANNSKSLFLAHMSHELRTPLNAILGFSEVMTLGVFGQLSERYSKYARDIHQSAEHLLSLINDLLDLARIEAGKFDLNESEVDFEEIISEITVILQPLTKGAGVTLALDEGVTLGTLLIDRRAIFQVFLNILSNAIKYSPAGSCVYLEKSLTPQGEAIIKVRDNGPGIDEEELTQILEPFVRGANAMIATPEGTGLGLPLSAAFIREHGGALDIDSHPGRGTTVVITLPPNRILGEIPTLSGPATSRSAS